MGQIRHITAIISLLVIGSIHAVTTQSKEFLLTGLYTTQNLEIEKQLETLGLEKDVVAIFGLDSSKWKAWIKGSQRLPRRFTPLTQLLKGRGYWVVFDEESSPLDTLSLPLADASSIYVHSPGHVLVNFHLGKSIGAEEIFGSAALSTSDPSHILSVWGFDQATHSWRVYKPGGNDTTHQSLETISPGQPLLVKTAVAGLTIRPPGVTAEPLYLEGGAIYHKKGKKPRLTLRPLRKRDGNRLLPQFISENHFRLTDPGKKLSLRIQAYQPGGEIQDLRFSETINLEPSLLQKSRVLLSIDRIQRNSRFDKILQIPASRTSRRTFTLSANSPTGPRSEVSLTVDLPRSRVSGFGQVFHSLGRALSISGSSLESFLDSEQVQEIRVLVTGPNMSPIELMYQGFPSSGIIYVPFGPDRKFQVDFLDGFGDVVRRGELVININPSSGGSLIQIQPQPVDLPLPVLSISPFPGTFEQSQEVQLEAIGGTVVYTLDGTNPKDAGSGAFSSSEKVSFTLTRTTSIQAFSTDGSQKGGIYIFTFEQVAQSLPVLSTNQDPVNGVFLNGVHVNIETQTPGSTIFYTLDGSEPNDSSTTASAPFSLFFSQTTTLSLYAQNEAGARSDSQTVEYKVLSAPTQIATSLSFTDKDLDPQKISGRVTVTLPADLSNIDSFVLGYGLSPTIRIQNGLITTLTPIGSSITYDFPPGTTLPGGTTHLLIFAANAAGEASEGISTPLEDRFLPLANATGVTFTDVDINSGELEGTVIIEPANNESSLDSYSLYFADSAGNKLGSDPLAILLKTGQTLVYQVPAGTDLPGSAEFFAVYSQNSNGEVTEPVLSQIVDLFVDLTQINANAGTDQSVQVHSLVILNASNSNNPAQNPISFSWTLASKPKGSRSVLVDENSINPEIVPDLQGTYQLSLRVKDTITQLVSPADILEIEAVAASTGGTRIVDLSAGGHTCAISDRRELWCWGPNSDGQLGTGNRVSSHEPRRVPLPGPVKQVSTSFYHTCALDFDGVAYCWGDNSSGQLGDGTSVRRLLPTTVTGLGPAQSISAGNFFTCAVQSDGSTHCWGTGSSGQLGLGDFQPRAAPSKLFLEDMVSVTTGDYHACALGRYGFFWCWGEGASGQLGNGLTDRRILPTLAVPDSPRLRSLKAGDSFGCAITFEGEMGCLGRNGIGQLGQGHDQILPLGDKVSLPGLVEQMSPGSQHACAVLTGGDLYCWGSSDRGQLGIPGILSSYVPRKVEHLSNVSLVAAGNYHTCSVQNNGSVACWGHYDSGRLGLEVSENQSLPVTLPWFGAEGVSAPKAKVAPFVRSAPGDTRLFASATDPDSQNLTGSWRILSSPSGADATLLSTDGYLARLQTQTTGTFELLFQVTDGENYDREKVIVEILDLGERRDRVKDISAYKNTCAALENGEIRCWGPNSGSLGNDVLDPADYPRTVQGFTDAVQVSVGELRTCALHQGGLVSCWGSNSEGALGISSDAISSTTPLTLPLNNISQVEMGNLFSCALSQDGLVSCWGYGYAGQLGVGSKLATTQPVQVQALENVIQIAAGRDHACALTQDSRVLCWGEGNSGQIGYGSSIDRVLPGPVYLGENRPVFIDAQESYSCVVTESGKVLCWGFLPGGFSGAGGISNAYEAVMISGFSQVTQISAGKAHLCAINTEQELYCIGNNLSGQLGTGNFQGQSLPQKVPLKEPVSRVAAGDEHTCSLLQSGRISCFGKLTQIGPLAGENRSDPVTMPGFARNVSSAPVALAGPDRSGVIGDVFEFDGSRSYDLNGDSRQFHWSLAENPAGSSPVFQTSSMTAKLTADAPGDYKVLLEVSDGSLKGTDEVHISVSDTRGNDTGFLSASSHENTCFIQSNGALYCWSAGGGAVGWTEGTASDVPVPVSPTESFRDVSAGPSHACAVTQGKLIRCWGSNAYGQLGDGTLTTRDQPVTVLDIDDALDVRVGSYHTCALRESGNAFCWGWGGNGILGNGSAETSTSPVKVVGLENLFQISVGNEHSCALDRLGQVHCWGRGNNFRLGNGSSSHHFKPAPVGLPESVVELDSGSAHNCARTEQGTVYCWGLNTDFQLGTQDTSQLNPEPTVGVEQAKSIALGSNHSCAVLLNSQLSCWGLNSNGQLGDGLQTRGFPSRVQDLTSVHRAFAGNEHTCASLTDGRLACWGKSSAGQLGIGSLENRSTPHFHPAFKETGNLPPIADLGPDIQSTRGDIPLNLSRSRDPNGDTLSPKWTLLTSPNQSVATISSKGVLQTDFAGTYEVQLDLSDGEFQSSDLIRIYISEDSPVQRSPVQITASQATCVVGPEGELGCWGEGSSGMLGNGDENDRSFPVPVQTDGKVRQVSLGTNFGCAVFRDGSANCWGNNSNSQLGDGTSQKRLLPVTVANLTKLRQVSTGAFHSCALHAAGTVSCWGFGGSGRLGNGFSASSPTPVEVLDLESVRQINGGLGHTCAMLQSGEVYTWGQGSQGGLGNNSSEHQNRPVPVIGLPSPARTLSCGDKFGCALLSDGSIYCWGSGTNGRTGQGNTNHILTASKVETLPVMAQVSTGLSHACAVSQEGGVYCWGRNDHGELGIEPTGDRLEPVRAQLEEPALGIAVGDHHSCAVIESGEIRCWGRGSNGELGHGRNIEIQPQPQKILRLGVGEPVLLARISIPGSPNAEEIHLDSSYSILTESTTYLWQILSSPANSDSSLTQTTSPASQLHNSRPGDYRIGLSLQDASQISTDTIEFRVPIVVNAGPNRTVVAEMTVPLDGSESTQPQNSDISYLWEIPQKPAGSTVTVLSPNSLVTTFQADTPGFYQLKLTAAKGTQLQTDSFWVQALSSDTAARRPLAMDSWDTTCVVYDTGELGCFGEGGSGQLGRGSTVDSTIVTPVSNLTDFIQVATGEDHTCAVAQRGKVYCWGDNHAGQLGDGTSTQSLVPVTVLMPLPALEVKSGRDFSCALSQNGRVFCWGANTNFELGLGYSGNQQTAQPVALEEPAIEITVGLSHACALVKDGQIRCWGKGTKGQLGNGSILVSRHPVPIEVEGTRFTQVDAGTNHTCALSESGRVWCWGNNANFQLGHLGSSDQPVPSMIPDLKEIFRISMGTLHSCAMDQYGSAYCWGTNSSGQLGNGTTQNSATPNRVDTLVPVAAISAGNLHSCALLQNGMIQCWGSQSSGRFGNGLSSGTSTTPVTASGFLPLSYLPPVPKIFPFSPVFGEVVLDGSKSQDPRFLGLDYSWSLDVLPGGASSDLSNPTSSITGKQTNLSGTYGLSLSVDNGTASNTREISFEVPLKVEIGRNRSVGVDNPVELYAFSIADPQGDQLSYSWSLNSVPQQSTAQLSNSAGTTNSFIPDASGTYQVEVSAFISNQSTSDSILITAVATDLRPAPAVDIVAGESDTTCELLQNGSVRCWGIGERIGDGDSQDREHPTAVLNISSAIQLSSGTRHNCAVLEDGGVNCWGHNGKGRLGDGTSTDSTSPVSVIDLPSALRVAAGDDFTCSIDHAGNAWCWGGNVDGQLGDGSTTDSLEPVRVQNLPPVKDITASEENSVCALSVDESVYCWGSGNSGQLGNGSSSDLNLPGPVQLPGAGVQKIALGLKLGCALHHSGEVSCWGNSTFLGTSLVTGNLPQLVEGLDQIIDIDVSTHSCAVRSDGDLFCWGQHNDVGQQGTEDLISRLIPTKVPGIRNVSKVAVSRYHTCALLRDGQTWCFGKYGYNLARAVGSTTHFRPTAGDNLGPSFNASPVAYTGPDLNLALGVIPLDGTLSFDPNADPLNYSWEILSSPAQSSASITQETESKTNFEADIAGTYLVQLNLTDSSGNTDSDQLSIQATNSSIPGVISLSARSRACAALSDGQVICWGQNSRPTGLTPGWKTLPGTTKQVSVGNSHSCALQQSGEVWCWRDNARGKLGDGTTNSRESAAPVTSINNAVAVSAGNDHTCVLLSDGKVQCFGTGSSGEMGNGLLVSTNSNPTFVNNLKNIVQLSSGERFSCALDVQGVVRCWGYGATGRLGQGNSTATRTLPVLSGNPNEPVVQISSGLNHSCAVQRNGQVRCWGNNANGRLGNGALINSLEPVIVPGLVEMIQVSTGRTHTCALQRNGNVFCWGSGANGELGNADFNDHHLPVQVQNLPPAKLIIAGDYISCALSEDTQVFCWGKGADGQLASGLFSDSYQPQSSTILQRGHNNLPQVSAGLDFNSYPGVIHIPGIVLAPGKDQTQLEWELLSQPPLSKATLSAGIDARIELREAIEGTYVLQLKATNGSGIVTDSVVIEVAPEENGIVDFSVWNQTCVLRIDGSPHCFGSGFFDTSGNPSQLPETTLVQISRGSAFSCAVGEDGGVYCWGDNSQGQLGDGTRNTSTTPYQTLSPQQILQVSAGGQHACAIKHSGEVLCWGANGSGQLGSGDYVRATSAALVPGIHNAIQVSAGEAHTCAVLVDGDLACWGKGSFGRLGVGMSSTPSTMPVPVYPPLEEVVQVSCADEHTCARTRSGEVYCWGRNSDGRLGTGNLQNQPVPTRVIHLPEISHISAGGNHTCAMSATKEALCWGLGSSGQLGVGDLNSSNIPLAVHNLSPVGLIEAGQEYTCALQGDGVLKCFGTATDQRLGSGISGISNLPVEASPYQHAASLPPIAHAGVDQRVSHARLDPTHRPGSVFLDASQSYHPGGTTLTYQWTRVAPSSGASTHISSPASVRTAVSWQEDGVYTFKLTLNDGQSLATDEVTIQSDDSLFAPPGPIALDTHRHTCIVLESGEINCFGLGNSGQLGNGLNLSIPSLVKTSATRSIVQVATGNSHTCAVDETGFHVSCWGNGSAGRLGQGVIASSLLPVDVNPAFGFPVRQISAGDEHTCVLLANEEVHCWGRGTSGQLGNRELSNQQSPVLVKNLNGTRKISSGGLFTCALNHDGRISCWGTNSYGELGDGGVHSFRNYAAHVREDLKARDLSCGKSFCCALTVDGEVKCWGRGNKGQLGGGLSLSSSAEPVRVRWLNGVDEISAGSEHACARKQGRVTCWGRGTEGQLGTGGLKNHLTPVQVHGIETAATITTGESHSCALLQSGEIYCWGGSENGESGTGNRQNLTPSIVKGFPAVANTAPIARLAPIPTLRTAESVKLDARDSFDPNSDTLLAQWSLSSVPANSQATITPSADLSAEFIPDLPGSYLVHLMVSDGEKASSIVQEITVTSTITLKSAPLDLSADKHACAVMSNGELICWGKGDSGQLGNGFHDNSSTPVRVIGLGEVIQVSAGASHTCAVSRDGTAHCWGSNSGGKLGDGTSTTRTTPVTVSTVGETLREVSVGETHSCGLSSNGKVYCWGRGSSGQIGNNSILDSAQPALVEGISDAIQVAAGAYHNCALRANGTASCWGWNGTGQLGIPISIRQSQIPTTVPDLSDGISIQAGNYHTCVLFKDGVVECFGHVSQGILGNGNLVSTTHTLQMVLSGENFKRISSGFDHNCALNTDGEAFCFGNNNNGQLGLDGEFSSFIPRRVESERIFTRIAAGSQFTCALQKQGKIFCWGSNQSGELGFGSKLNTRAPGLSLPLDGVQNTRPVAHAGNGRRVQLGVVELNGSRSYDPNGDALSFSWTILSSPANSVAQILFPSSVETDLAVDLEGAYHIRLEVTDGELFDQDDIRFDASILTNSSNASLVTTSRLSPSKQSTQTPNHPPVAVAGNDLRASVAYLDGSRSIDPEGEQLNFQWSLLNSELFEEAAILDSFNSKARFQAFQPGTYLVELQVSDGEFFSIDSLEIEVPPPSEVLEFSLSSHSCALREDGKTFCWGPGARGQLGNGLKIDQLVPSGVQFSGFFQQVSVGALHTCAIDNYAEIWCWGENMYGALGTGDRLSSPIPVPASLSQGALQISAGRTHTCALLEDNTLHCWGVVSAAEPEPSAMPASPIPMYGTGAFQSILSSQNYICAEQTSGELNCWDSIEPGIQPRVIDSSPNHGKLFAGTSGICSLGENGAVSCLDLQLGKWENSTTLPGAVELAIGSAHICARTLDGKVYCFGQGSNFELGHENLESSPDPVEVLLGGKVQKLHAGDHHTCALMNSGELKCWGLATGGRLGTGPIGAEGTPRAEPVQGLSLPTPPN
jgi:alpha-tubulin suppressor-like RCC1 family protein